MHDHERQEMVEMLVSAGYLTEKHVIDAMRKVPRHLFVPKKVRVYAYLDRPLPVGQNQTISAPHMVAMMCEHLDIKEGLKVLEIGAGTGYHACVVSEIIQGKVFSVENKGPLIKAAKENLKEAGCTGVELVEGDGTEGHEKEAPYDRIFVTAGAPNIPAPLVRQLKVGGRLLLPVGSRHSQSLVQVDKGPGGNIEQKTLSSVAFVPLTGKFGW